ncbi:MAG TPA: phenylalanine--tRNA ligase subunit beta [bacterium]|jgi:phenylalanyl-tRNA synthetase beta chain|nr:phenylalanine--tRNA ligase subunit beta [bacterium]HOX84743.1 phenylalanine--tRNA ligase subunit beta [bacterium]HPG45466.1 phenylalanine--tRNA ligase subunit beta [bacterium]HPM96758.1 phenylalanine--tRNA ligase subunit beta [bacterium]
MPVVAISARRLNELLGREYDMAELVDALEQLGTDVEDTAEQALYRCPACQAPNDKPMDEEPPKRCDFCGHAQEDPFERFASETVIRLDLLAARPDLFDVGGLSRALKGYLHLQAGLPEFTVQDGAIRVEVDPDLSNEESYRPFIACAAVTMPPLDHNSLREIMRLQENLHWGIGRDRKLASIGVYDLAAVQPPIRYTLIDPQTFGFCPLGMPGVQMTAARILQEHPKGIAYANLMQPYQRYPILLDAQSRVLSMPPIINSDETKCRLGTRRLFIDVTGISRDAVINSLNTLTSALAELGGQIENVEMHYPDRVQRTPDLTPRSIQIRYSEALKWLGIDCSPEEFVQTIRKMRLNVEHQQGDQYQVFYPPFRTDIRHEVDIFEDLAIGYGFGAIEPRLVPTMTIAQERPEERLSNLVRDAMIGLGFTEIMSLLLQSEERQFAKFRMQTDERTVIISNPKTIEQKTARTHMMTGILETLQKNRRKAVPQRLFELGNVIHVDPDAETGTREYRHLAFAIIGPEAGYAESRKILDAVMREINRRGTYAPDDHPAFCEGRCAQVNGPDGLWARLGEFHPQVLNNFGLSYPVVFAEMRLTNVI